MLFSSRDRPGQPLQPAAPRLLVRKSPQRNLPQGAPRHGVCRVTSSRVTGYSAELNLQGIAFLLRTTAA